LKDVLAGKEMTSNVLSDGKLATKGYEIIFDNKEAVVRKKGEERVLLRAPFDGKLWSLNFKMNKTKENKENPILICETRLGKRKREMKGESIEPEIKQKKEEDKRKPLSVVKKNMEPGIEQLKGEVKVKISQQITNLKKKDREILKRMKYKTKV